MTAVTTSCGRCGGPRPPRGAPCPRCLFAPTAVVAPLTGVWVGDQTSETVVDVPRPAVVAPPPDPAPRDWLAAEGEQFRRFVAQEWDKLRHGRHLLIDIEAQAQAALTERQMGVSRAEAELLARVQELADRARGVAEREQELERAAEGLAEREAAVRAAEAAAAAVEATRRAAETEAAELGRLAAELRAVVAGLEFRRGELEAARAELAERQAVLDRRFVQVGRAEVAAAARERELDEWESAGRAEFDARERELARQRAEWNEQVRTLRPPIEAG